MQLPSISRRRLFWSVVAAAVAALVLWPVLRPKTVDVDFARVDVGSLRVTIDEDGLTRVTERHVVSSPVTGQLQRSTLEAGDPVASGEAIARLAPLPLDTRMQREAADRLAAAQATARAAAARVERAEAEHRHATSTRERLEQVEADAPGAISQQRLDAARTAERAAGAAVEEALQGARAADRQVDVARAQLLGSVPQPAPDAQVGVRVGTETLTVVTSPATGRVLRVHEADARVVAAGAPLLEVGDPSQLEVVADVLTDDALQVAPGVVALVTVPGSPDTLAGVVDHIEPSAFTRVSPLGVEEQRVNVIVSLAEAPAKWLGDRYRVSVGLVAWHGDEVVRVPVSALFRLDGRWAVWTVHAGRAHSTPIEIGHRNRVHAEVVTGLEPGTTVIIYPPESLSEGARVRADLSRAAIRFDPSAPR